MTFASPDREAASIANEALHNLRRTLGADHPQYAAALRAMRITDGIVDAMAPAYPLGRE